MTSSWPNVLARKRLSAGRMRLGMLWWVAGLLSLRHCAQRFEMSTATALPPAVSPLTLPSRRTALLLSLSALSAAGALPAQAVVATKTKEQETVNVPANTKNGYRGYTFEKPAGFKRLTNIGDPSGFVFRNVNDTYFSFATRAEIRENATTDFKPEAFIDDYQNKFVNTTGSSFTLLKGGGNPDREDKTLGVLYYEVEYVVRTQLGFAFDSIKTLHFLTTFAVTKNNINVLNCQALDDKWEADGSILRRITDSFRVTE